MNSRKVSATSLRRNDQADAADVIEDDEQEQTLR
jgi:hypothetical protein